MLICECMSKKYQTLWHATELVPQLYTLAARLEVRGRRKRNSTPVHRSVSLFEKLKRMKPKLLLKGPTTQKSNHGRNDRESNSHERSIL